MIRLPGRAAFLGTLGTGSLIQALTLITGVLVARSLGPEGRGVLAAVVLWPGLAAGIGLLGTNSSLSIYAAKRVLPHSDLYGLAVGMGLLLSVLAALVCWLLLPLILPRDQSELLGLARLYLLFIPLNIIVTQLTAVDHGAGLFARLNVARLVLNPVYLAIVLYLWLSGVSDVSAFVFALLAANAVTLGVRVTMSAPGSLLPRLSGRTWRLFKEGVPYLVTDTVGLLHRRIDQIFIVWLLEPRALGLYVVALAASGTHMIFAKSLNMVVFARGASLGREAAAEDIAALFRYLVIAGGVVGLLMIAILPLAIPLVYGVAFGDAVMPALVLLTANYLMGQADLINEGLRGQARPFPGMQGRILAAIVFALGGLGLAWAGLLGLACALAAAQVVYLAHMIRCVRAVHSVRLRPTRSDCDMLLSLVRQAPQSVAQKAAGGRGAEWIRRLTENSTGDVGQDV